MMQSYNKDTKLIFFLGPHFGVLFLRLMKRHYDFLNYKVITYSNKSDSYYGYESVPAYCTENHIDFLDVSVEKRSLLQTCISFKPSIVICGFYARILPIRIVDLPPGGAYNVHPGKLPKYRGPFPTAWAILNNEDSFGITIHRMEREIDTGPICVQKCFPILPEETGYELYLRSMRLSAEVLCSSIPSLLDKSFAVTEQREMGSYYGRIPSHHHIDWSNTSRQIKNLVRVHSKPYFPVYSFVKNKILLINRCTIDHNVHFRLQGPGKVIETPDQAGFPVTCGDGVIQVTDYEVCPTGAAEVKTVSLWKGLQLN
ncbi:MAG: hypothetical protein C4576_20290 [Desulfobacteraceae bacterium]|nr:MAG: hypothetical protein C4576_20290 [Desulfobacteraceae bacterium]